MNNLPTLEPGFEWFTTQVQWLFLIVFIGIPVFLISKRSWMGAALFIVGSAFIGIFLNSPQTVLDLAEGFADMFRFNG